MGAIAGSNQWYQWPRVSVHAAVNDRIERSICNSGPDRGLGLSSARWSTSRHPFPLRRSNQREPTVSYLAAGSKRPGWISNEPPATEQWRTIRAGHRAPLFFVATTVTRSFFEYRWDERWSAIFNDLCLGLPFPFLFFSFSLSLSFCSLRSWLMQTRGRRSYCGIRYEIIGY